MPNTVRAVVIPGSQERLWAPKDPSHCAGVRRGFSLIEIVIWFTLAGVLAGLALPKLAGWRDRLAVRAARLDATAFYQTARHAAMARGTPVRVAFAPDTLVAVFEGVRDSVFLARAGPLRRGVTLIASQSSIRLHPTGVGFGAANLKLVFRKGRAADSLTTSRLGRLKLWL